MALTRAQYLAPGGGSPALSGQPQGVKPGSGIKIGTDGTISFDSSSASGTFKLQPADAYNNYMWPTTPGTAKQVLTTDGQGNLTWAAAAGDITGVFGTNGITGGGSVGEVTLSLVPATASTIGGVKQGTNIVIAADGTISSIASGDITKVSAGPGLSGGGDKGDVTLALAPPTGGAIGGVKQGTNIFIAADGTISATSPSGLGAPVADVNIIDSIAGQFNGSQTTFNLTSAGKALPSEVGSAQAFISVGGIVQSPNGAYTLSNSSITFTQAPPAGASFSGRYFEGGVIKLLAGNNITLNPPSGIGEVVVSSTASGGIDTVTAGKGLSGGGSTSTVTLTNAGVTSLTAGTNINLSGSTGDITISATPGGGGISTVNAGSGLQGGGSSSTVTLSLADDITPNTMRARSGGSAGGVAVGIGGGNGCGLYGDNDTLYFATGGSERGRFENNGYFYCGNRIVAGGGGPANPAFQVANQSNTGIYSDGSGLGFSVDGNSRGKFDNSGNFYVNGSSKAATFAVEPNGSYCGFFDQRFTVNTTGAVLNANSGPSGSTVQLTIQNTDTSAGAAIQVRTVSGAGPTVVAYRNGDRKCTGAFSKGSGPFKIPHPLPELEETKYLVHSFIEGPQADLIYRGVAILKAGKAEINIDEKARMTEGTFEVLCRDVSCFTTNESDWTPVRGSVSGNILTIQAEEPSSTARVSWLVIGERKDKHMLETGWTDDEGRPIMEPDRDTTPLPPVGWFPEEQPQRLTHPQYANIDKPDDLA